METECFLESRMGSRTSRGGPENKIHIREVNFWVSEKFGIFPVEDREGSRRFRGVHHGAHDPRRANMGRGGAA